MAHGDAREGKWRGNMRMEWVASSLALYVGTWSIHGLSADPHSSTASSRLNWLPRRFKWTRPFCWKTKSGFCACAITFRMCSTTFFPHYLINGTIFEKKNCINIKCVFIFSANLSETFLIPKIIQRDTITQVNRSSWKVPVILVIL